MREGIDDKAFPEQGAKVSIHSDGSFEGLGCVLANTNLNVLTAVFYWFTLKRDEPFFIQPLYVTCRINCRKYPEFLCYCNERQLEGPKARPLPPRPCLTPSVRCAEITRPILGLAPSRPRDGLSNVGKANRLIGQRRGLPGAAPSAPGSVEVQKLHDAPLIYRPKTAQIRSEKR